MPRDYPVRDTETSRIVFYRYCLNTDTYWVVDENGVLIERVPGMEFCTSGRYQKLSQNDEINHQNR